MKRGKTWCSLLLTAGMTLDSLTGLTMGDANMVKAAENTAPGKPTDLKTEMLREAYGIDTKNPAFSWVVNDTDADEVQTAYRILVSKTSALQGEALDTGWVESGESSFVHAPKLEEKLEDNQLYYWQVQTKDKAGAESPLSDAAPFMTDIASEWQSLDGIWAVPGAAELENWKDYTVEATVSIQSGDALALLMCMDGGNNGYMIQLRDKDNAIKAHSITNGGVNTGVNSPEFQTLNFSEKGITLPKDKSEFQIKLTAKGSEILVAVDTGTGYQDAGAIHLASSGTVITAGKPGFRTGRYESGTVADLKITGSDGEMLYESGFSSDDGFFSGCSVSGGKLSVGNSAYAVLNNPDQLQERGNISFLRSPGIEISDKSNIDKAIISAAARGTAIDRGTIFDLFFNGECIGAGSARELGNVGGFSSGSGYTQVYYNSYDVTDLLAQGGQNVISAVGNCRDEARGILIQMTLFYKDGTKETVTNSGAADSGWKTLDGTNAFGDEGQMISAENNYMKLFHDNINMEAYPEGWNTVTYDDSGWQAAKVNQAVADRSTGRSGRVLYPSLSENTLRFETNETAKRIYQNNAGNVVVDLGKEIIGGLKVNINSSTSQKITVYMGEEMDGDGVKHKLTASPDYVDTWTLKSGMNAFETITMRNVRYVELIGLDHETKQSVINNPDSMKGWAIQQEFDENDSSFTASGSDEAKMLNRLYEFSKYSIKATNQDVFVDSQARERVPYEGDLLVNSNTSYAVSGNYSLARHSNEWLIDNPTWPNDYSLFSVEMSYWDYIYTGNTDSIRENYEGLKKKLTTKVESEDSNTGLLYVKDSQAGRTALIDWPTSERDGYQGSRYDVVLNAEYVGIYRYMAIICDALQKTEDAACYRAKADKLQNSLITYAYDKTNGCFYDSLDQSYNATKHFSTHATAYALAYGVFDSSQMADAMCEFVYNNCKEEFKGSVYVTYFILKGLYMGNHGELAQKLMTNPKVGTDVKTFASLLDNLHCTITPEAWGHAYKRNMTLSHPWGASPGCSIVQGMFGILPTKAGFEEFSVKLQPGGIPEASVTAPTIKGKVSVSYTNGSEADLQQNKLRAEVTIPANSRAVVSLPVNGNNYSCLMVDGEKIEAAYDGTYLSVTLGSGAHSISISEETVDLDKYFDLAVSAERTNLPYGASAQIITELIRRDGSKVTENKEVSYRSLNPDVVTVSEDGLVKGIGAGTAEVEITASYEGLTKKERLSFTVEAEQVTLTGLELCLSAGSTLTVGSSSQAVLQNVYSNGKKEAVASDVTYTVKGDAVTVDSTTGSVTAQKAGNATVIAKTAANTKALAAISSEQIGSMTEWNFDGTTNPLGGGVSLNDGRIYANVSQTADNTDSDKQGNIVAGTFEIEAVAANIAFNVKDSNNRYFWQFQESGSLKKHKQQNGTITDFGRLVPITVKNGENTFRIATVGNKIYTWLNGELVDVCDTQDDMPVSGGFGIRNGRTESFYLNSISVGQDLVFQAETEVTVTEEALPYIIDVSTQDTIEAPVGTLFGELDLPKTVTVTLSDNTTREIAVDWSGEYDASKAGEYTLTGILAAGEDYENPENIQAAVKIVVESTEVKKPDIVSVQRFTDIKTTVGTAFEKLPLPAEAEVALSDHTTKKIGVTWANGSYDASKAGTYTLAGTLAAGTEYMNTNGIQATVKVTVTEASSDGTDHKDPSGGSGSQNPAVKPVVKLNAKSLPLQVKKSTNVLKASGMIAGDKVLKWESSKPSVASVNKKTGKITAKKKTGTTIIKVTTKKGATAACTIKVQKGKVKTKKVVVTNVTKNKLTLKKGKSFKLAAERQPLTATDKISYSSSKKSVAAVNKSGKITAKKKGKTVITVKSANNKKTKITVTVK